MMAARSHSRGWPITFEGGKWVYDDTKEKVVEDRCCRRCDRPPTKEGYDACLGFISGATSACCGHGSTDAFIFPGVKE